MANREAIARRLVYRFRVLPHACGQPLVGSGPRAANIYWSGGAKVDIHPFKSADICTHDEQGYVCTCTKQ
jgi:hypothetical protein